MIGAGSVGLDVELKEKTLAVQFSTCRESIQRQHTLKVRCMKSS